MFAKRIEELKKVLDLDTDFIVTSDENRFYLSGFHSSAGCVVVTQNTATLLIDFRYFEKASAVVSHIDVKLCTKVYENIKEILNAENIKNVQIETASMTVDGLERMRKALTDFDVITKPNLSQKLSELRQIKTSGETDLIKKCLDYLQIEGLVKNFNYIFHTIFIKI